MRQEFTARAIREDTYLITGGTIGCDCYLLVGSSEALMVDAGCPEGDIRAFAQSLTEKPVRAVVNTHSHFDHTGGNGYFERVLASPRAIPSLKNTMGEPPERYPLDYTPTPVMDWDLLDPGGRPLRILELGSHSPGSLAVLDESRRLLFCGDEVDSGQCLLLPGFAEKPGQVHARPASTVEGCLRAMERLRSLRGAFGAICPAHNGSPVDRVYLDWFAALCRGILSGEIVGEADCSSGTYGPGDTHYPYPGAGYLRASYRGASLVYSRFLLREEELMGAESLPPATPLHLISSYSIGGAL